MVLVKKTEYRYYKSLFFRTILTKLNRSYLRDYNSQAEVRKDYDSWRISEAQKLFSIFKQAINFKDKLLLDLGCGNGQPSIFYAIHSGASHVIGIDMEPQVIDYAKKLAKRL